jgi:hypothetical protein
MKTTFKEYLYPRYNAYVAGMEAQAKADGVEFVQPSISDFLAANAKARDEREKQEQARKGK